MLKSPKLFARKFDEVVDGSAVDQLDLSRGQALNERVGYWNKQLMHAACFRFPLRAAVLRYPHGCHTTGGTI